MANPIYQTITTHTNSSDGLKLIDRAQSPFNVSWAVEVPAGVTTSYTVQYTLDDVNDAAWTPVWFPDPINSTAQTASVAGNYLSPITAIRVNVSALSGGTALIRLAILQGSSAR